MADWATLAATLIAPLAAVQATRWLDRRRDRHDRRFQIFRTLMMTRGQWVSAAHVEALNLIDVEFHGRSHKERAITDAYKAHLDHLSQKQHQAWFSKRDELFGVLLYKMALFFKVDLDPVHLKNQAYLPAAYVDRDAEELQLRRAWITFATGKSPLPIVVGAPLDGARSNASPGATTAQPRAEVTADGGSPLVRPPE